MHRFYLPPERCSGGTLVLDGREAHHALHVLRLRGGDAVTVLDGAGTVFHCTVAGTGRDRVDLAVRERQELPPLPCAITLLQAVPKGKIIESIIQKATELGVARIVPLLTDRVVTHLDASSAEAKTGKWQQVAVEAIKQSGNPWLPTVEAPVTPTIFLARREHFDLALIGSLNDAPVHPRAHFEQHRRAHGRFPARVALWIGPEGDFTPEEVAAARAAGVRPITLGRLVLRVETAAAYCLSVVNHEAAWNAGEPSAS
jgi:16S rRNA (uracil1498-N3)-methyltransferase